MPMACIVNPINKIEQIYNSMNHKKFEIYSSLH
jgi:hypothetical protein